LISIRRSPFSGVTRVSTLILCASVSGVYQGPRREVVVDFVFTQTELAEDRSVVFALEGWIAERLELFARETPRTARQAVYPPVAVRDFLDCAPIFRPFQDMDFRGRPNPRVERPLELIASKAQSALFAK
jgi:hypothetical protein